MDYEYLRQKRNGSKGSVRDLWGPNFCKNPRKSASLPCPFKKGYDNVRMNDPLEVNGAASSVAAARAIMRDQVHMHSIGYARLAEDIKELAHSWLLSKKRKGSGWDRPEPKRIWLDMVVEKGATGRGNNSHQSQLTSLFLIFL